MNFRHESQAYVDEEGRLIIPREELSLYGLKPGSQIRVERKADSLLLRCPVTHLRKVYIEPTNRCNLDCRTCIRNVWDEPLGQMSSAVFDRIMEGLRDVSPTPTVFFGGFGEPLAHPDIVEMVTMAKSLGANVELITNGMLLTPDISRKLIEVGLDTLWVSIDGSTPESYADVRLGAALPQVLANLADFRKIRWASCSREWLGDYNAKPAIGVVFVAMRSNIADFPAVVRLSSQFGAKRFLLTNLLPYTPAMCKEILYNLALTDTTYASSLSNLDLPKINVDEITRDSLYAAMRSGHGVTFAGRSLGDTNDLCPFVETGATAISWDGNLSPCLPLLHNHVSYVDDRERFSRRYVVGNLDISNFSSLWNDHVHLAFRDRVQRFDFSPCTWCGGCDMAEKNEEDCFGSPFPTCGGCLWAQGVIRCP